MDNYVTSEELRWGRASMAAWVTTFLEAKKQGEGIHGHPVLDQITTEAANDPRNLTALLGGAAALGASLVNAWAHDIDEDPQRLWQEFLSSIQGVGEDSP